MALWNLNNGIEFDTPHVHEAQNDFSHDSPHFSSRSNPSPRPASSARAACPSMRLAVAGEMAGGEVVDFEGLALGDVRGLVIDVYQGRVAYLIVSLRPDLRTDSGSLRIVPWHSVSVDPNQACFTLNVEEETLVNAPACHPGELPDMSQPDWALNTHKHYEARPYWD
ncbi:hypothetical protein JCM19000A_31310 [Silvimonas sp. JCM 19000]